MRSSKRSTNCRLWEQLEDRIVFDAAPDGDLSQLLVSGELFGDDPFTPAVNAESTRAQPALADSEEQSEVRREIVFVDASVDDYQQLVDGLLGDVNSNRRLDVGLHHRSSHQNLKTSERHDPTLVKDGFRFHGIHHVPTSSHFS